MAHLGFNHVHDENERFQLIAMNTFEPMSPEIVHRPHGTPYWLFVFFYDEATLRLGNELLSCSANSLVLWPPGQEHYLGNDSQRWRHAWFFAKGSLIEDCVRSQQIPTLSVLQLSNHHETDTFFNECYRELGEHEQPDIEIIAHLLSVWLRRVHRDIHQDTQHNTRLMKLKRFIENNLDQELKLSDLAKEAGLSASHLSSEFKQHFQCSPIDYLIKRRLDQARHLLSNHNLQIKQIAARVGYHDVFHFSRIFKKNYGMSPRAMRQTGPSLNREQH